MADTVLLLLTSDEVNISVFAAYVKQDLAALFSVEYKCTKECK
jgi:hypothetical protein